MRDAIVSALVGQGLEGRATPEPLLADHQDVFGAPLSDDAGFKRADILVTDPFGGKSFYDITIAWDAKINAGEEVADPGRAERRAHARKASEYNPHFAGAAAKVVTLVVTPYGDLCGSGRVALRRVVHERASELAVASQAAEIKTYNNMISGLRTRLSVAFWRPTATARICSRLSREEWYARGLARPPAQGAMAGEFEIGPAA